jgi:hypothetical protein
MRASVCVCARARVCMYTCMRACVYGCVHYAHCVKILSINNGKKNTQLCKKSAIVTEGSHVCVL